MSFNLAMKEKNKFYILMGYFSFGFIFPRTVYGMINNELNLRQHLFNSSTYSPNIFPRRNLTDLVTISLQWTHVRLRALSEKDAKFTQDIKLDLAWKDDNLSWDPQQFGDITSFTTQGTHVWTPDLTFLNRLDSPFLKDGLEAEKVKVESDGTVSASPIGDFATICGVNPDNFPADCHRCGVLLSISKVSSRQILKWETPAYIDFSSTINSKHAYWHIERVDVSNNSLVPSLQFYIKRLPLYYTVTIVTSASALSCLSFLSFFIPIESGERISYSMTIFLSFMVLMLQVSNILPESSQSISAIGKYFLRLTCGSLISIVYSVILSFYDHRPVNSQDNQANKSKTITLTNDDKTGTTELDNHKLLGFVGGKGFRRCWKGFEVGKHLVSVMKAVCMSLCFGIIVFAHAELFRIINHDNCPYL